MDRARCFRCIKPGHWARDCTSAWSNPRNVYRGTRFSPGYSYFPTKHSQGMLPPARSGVVLEEDVSDIAQVIYPDLTSLAFCNPFTIIC